MAATKKPSVLEGWIHLGVRATKLVEWLIFRGEGRLTLAGLALLALLTVGPYFAWRKVGPRLLASPDYRLSAERVELLPEPASVSWIRRDVRSEALRDAGLEGGVSILDDDLCERVAKAVALHPWIAAVKRVSKRYPARVSVEVEYRRPAAMVISSEDVWWPVDTSGIVLPRDDFSPNEARRYPQITGIAAGPFGPTGTRWGDARVDAAAQIAAEIGPDWHKGGLARIAPLVVGTGEEGEEAYAFALFTERGRRIYWGSGPGDSRARHEPSTAEKAARLRRYIAEYGSLEGSPTAPDAGQDLDLRGTRGIVGVPISARNESLIRPVAR